MKVYDISRDILTAPLHKGDSPPRLQPMLSLEQGDEINLHYLYACTHAGTHVDAPGHTIQGGQTIDRLPPELFCGACRVVAFTEQDITGADIDRLLGSNEERLLIKGGGRARLTLSAAYALAQEPVLLVGIDAPSIAREEQENEVYRVLQQANKVTLEGLNLQNVPPGGYTLFAPPVLIAGADAAPCRALLFSLSP